MTLDKKRELEDQIKHGNMEALIKYLGHLQGSEQNLVNKTVQPEYFRWHQGRLDAILLILDLLPERHL